jgi:hypothetical protein
MRSLLCAVVLTLTFVGCSESPQQRAERIALECKAVVAQIQTLTAEIRDSDAPKLVVKCLLNRGIGEGAR